jgi:Mn-dependent DtxR family transcriptional regulator
MYCPSDIADELNLSAATVASTTDRLHRLHASEKESRLVIWYATARIAISRDLLQRLNEREAHARN